jgi:hypothetical protein
MSRNSWARGREEGRVKNPSFLAIHWYTCAYWEHLLRVQYVLLHISGARLLHIQSRFLQPMPCIGTRHQPCHAMQLATYCHCMMPMLSCRFES